MENFVRHTKLHIIKKRPSKTLPNLAEIFSNFITKHSINTTKLNRRKCIIIRGNFPHSSTHAAGLSPWNFTCIFIYRSSYAYYRKKINIETSVRSTMIIVCGWPCIIFTLIIIYLYGDLCVYARTRRNIVFSLRPFFAPPFKFYICLCIYIFFEFWKIV